VHVHATDRTGLTRSNARVKVAILDSGISPHQDLAPIAGGWNFISDNDNFNDDTNHGTHVAGTVGAIYNGYGVVGVAPETDESDRRASWSSTGPTLELSAPGVNIWSTWAGDVTTADHTTWTWVQYSGTSMASPHVAGVAALLVAEGVSDPLMVRAHLVGTAKPLGSVNHFGFGLVQAHEAIFAAAADHPEEPEEPATPLMTAIVSYSATGPRGRHLVVTVLVLGESGENVAGALVAGTLGDGSGGQWSYSGTTSSSGTVSFQRNNAPSGDYVFKVDAVSHPEYEWDGDFIDPGHSR